MGLSAKKKFLETHPFCCLCGGSVRATTIEHAPPIAFFINRQLPANDHRVPACELCNLGSSQHDQVAAFAALTMAGAHRHVPFNYWNKLTKGVKNNAPGAFRAITVGLRESKPFFLRANGILRKASAMPVAPALFRDWLDPWAVKQAYALHYLHTGEIIPPSARVAPRWSTNIEINKARGLKTLIRTLPNFGELRQGRNSSGVQFRYKWGVDGENACYLLLLQDASIAVIAVRRDALAAARFKKFGLFATNAEKGIHRLNLPQKTPTNPGIAAPGLPPG